MIALACFTTFAAAALVGACVGVVLLARAEERRENLSRRDFARPHS